MMNRRDLLKGTSCVALVGIPAIGEAIEKPLVMHQDAQASLSIHHITPNLMVREFHMLLERSDVLFAGRAVDAKLGDMVHGYFDRINHSETMLDKQECIDVKFPASDLALDLDTFSDKHIQPAANIIIKGLKAHGKRIVCAALPINIEHQRTFDRSGVAVRSDMQYDIRSDDVVARFDVLYGTVTKSKA